MSLHDGECELCTQSGNRKVYSLFLEENEHAGLSALLCDFCLNQLTLESPLDEKKWRVLGQSMWSEVPAVKILSWFLLQELSHEGWAQDFLSQIYLTDEELKWAEQYQKNRKANLSDDSEDGTATRDSNGAVLNEGDSIALIKDLDVKGASFTAKRGTIVKNIHLTSNPEHIEGRVNGTLIVILTKFTKKA